MLEDEVDRFLNVDPSLPACTLRPPDIIQVMCSQAFLILCRSSARVISMQVEEQKRRRPYRTGFTWFETVTSSH